MALSYDGSGMEVILKISLLLHNFSQTVLSCFMIYVLGICKELLLGHEWIVKTGTLHPNKHLNLSFAGDVTPPVLVFNNVPFRSNENVTIEWSVNEPANSTCTLSSPSGTSLVFCGQSWRGDSLREGFHTLYVTATDTSGNIGTTRQTTWFVGMYYTGLLSVTAGDRGETTQWILPNDFTMQLCTPDQHHCTKYCFPHSVKVNNVFYLIRSSSPPQILVCISNLSKENWNKNWRHFSFVTLSETSLPYELHCCT